MSFGTIVVVGGSSAEPKKLQELLVRALVQSGGDLSRNPRRMMAEVPCNAGQEAWDMLAGDTPFRVVVMPDASKTSIVKGDVLNVKFADQKKTLKFMKSTGGDGVLTISERVNPDRLPQLTNQFVADLVANDRRQQYLLSSEPKKIRHPSRQRERNSRQKERYGGLW